MIHEILPVGMLQVNCSICADEVSREAFVFDPGDEAGRILDTVARLKLRVIRIVLTHGHLDHIGGVKDVQEATHARVSLHPGDHGLVENVEAQAAMLGMAAPPRFMIDDELAEGDTLTLGPIEFRVLHTPGHTQGGCCFWIPSESRLIAGDTLFRDSVGRTDLPGGNMQQLLDSIHTKLMPLPDNTLVAPGHGAETTIGREKQFNYYLQGR